MTCVLFSDTSYQLGFSLNVPQNHPGSAPSPVALVGSAFMNQVDTIVGSTPGNPEKRAGLRCFLAIIYTGRLFL